MLTKFVENLKARYHFGYPGTDRRIILKRLLDKYGMTV
jgi:hypothetical protein